MIKYAMSNFGGKKLCLLREREDKGYEVVCRFRNDEMPLVFFGDFPQTEIISVGLGESVSSRLLATTKGPGGEDDGRKHSN